MNDLEQQPENYISWKLLSLRFFGGYFLVAILSHILTPWPVEERWTFAQKLFSYAFGYLVQFLFVFIIISIIAILIAKVSTVNRKKPLQLFLNGALTVTVVLSSILLLSAWNVEKNI